MKWKLEKKKRKTNIEFQREKLVTVGQTQAYERVTIDSSDSFMDYLYGEYIRSSNSKGFCLKMHGSEIINDRAENGVNASESTIFQFCMPGSTRSEPKNSSGCWCCGQRAYPSRLSIANLIGESLQIFATVKFVIPWPL